MNSGSEAVESAVKAVRKWGYEVKGVAPEKAEVIVCENNFHGRTITIISFSTDPAARSGFGPFTAGLKVIPYGDSKALEAAITPDTVGFMVEPIQGEAGVIMILPGLSGPFQLRGPRRIEARRAWQHIWRQSTGLCGGKYCLEGAGGRKYGRELG